MTRAIPIDAGAPDPPPAWKKPAEAALKAAVQQSEENGFVLAEWVFEAAGIEALEKATKDGTIGLEIEDHKLHGVRVRLDDDARESYLLRNDKDGRPNRLSLADLLSNNH